MKKSYESLMGRRFNRMTFEGQAGYVDGYAAGNFVCDCGVRKTLRIHAVVSGNTKSCGCFKSERTRETFITHAGTGTPEYRSYHEMKKRCLNPRNHAYSRYGGRGILICERWLESFENFRADMGPRPSPRHSLDREDNNGNYEPGNVRWATDATQSRNRRSTRKLTIGDLTMSHNEWAEELGVSRYMITSRVDQGLTGNDIGALFTCRTSLPTPEAR